MTAGRAGRPAPDADLATLADVELLALDVDGVLTDGRVVYGGSELELQRFSVADGLGLRLLLREGVRVVWITGRGCAATERRAAELDITELCVDVARDGKAAVLERIQERLGIGVAATAAMGDDLPDLGLAARSAFFACPADAREIVRSRAALVTHARGGEGAVRELAEHVLRAKGHWERIVGDHLR